MIIGLQVRHYKAYKGINFIPIGDEHNFVAYAGENGVGKSSILEALNTFLNNKEWFLTKLQKANDSYICPVFLIDKNKVSRLSNEFEIISDFFWDLEKASKNDEFFTLRENILKNNINKETHYLLYLGETYNKDLKIPLGSKIERDLIEKIEKNLTNFNEKKFLKELKFLYSYVYIPVEINSESFTKIETEEMQKVFDKKIKDEIKKSLKPRDIKSINDNLDDFVNNLEEKLDGKYFYDTGDEGKKKLTTDSLMNTVLEIYFKRRVLMKGNREDTKSSKKMSELSAGEKREALINLIYVFLKEAEERDSIVIIGIDEPENSLHTSICYEQFEKLKEVSANVQVFITTHWYGFLPIVDRGLVHFLETETSENTKGEIEENINFFHKTNLYDHSYQTKKTPNDFTLKSTNDLVQSIFHSLKAKKPYNWLICEGTSDKNYLNYFLKEEIKNNNLKIIAVGGIALVRKFYKYLSLPVEENIDDIKKGKIFCLTDTDTDLFTADINQSNAKLKKILVIKRLIRDNDNCTGLKIFESHEKRDSIDIEKSLNPTIFKNTLEILEVDSKFLINSDEIQNLNGNTTKENLKNWDIENLFISEEQKNNFSKKYIEIMKKELIQDDFIPSWVQEIKTFFNS